MCIMNLSSASKGARTKLKITEHVNIAQNLIPSKTELNI